MYAQQTSLIKRAGQAARKEFQVMHLAVFPFRAEFLKTNGLETLAYFEKGNPNLTQATRSSASTERAP